MRFHPESVRRPNPELFWSHVQRGEGCWEWQSIIDGRGYGEVRVYHDGRYFGFRAHRVSWGLTHGRVVPKGLYVCHKCNNRKCVKPDHLYAGTCVDNNRDRFAPMTHCKNGHELTDANVRRHGYHARICRACQCAAAKRYLARKRITR